jgi:hypothetical protein
MSRRFVVPAVLLAAHLGATVWIAASYRRSDLGLVVPAWALPLAQASLLAAWGVWARWPSYVRAPLVVIGATALWAVQCRSLDFEPGDERCAGHALGFAVQVLLVGGVLAMMRLEGWRISRRHHAPERRQRRIQFGISFVLSWVAAIAVILAAWKSASVYSGWTMEVVKGKFFGFGAVVGVYNALFALIALAAVWWGRRWYHVLAQAVPALVIACVFAASQSVVLRDLFDTDGYVGAEGWITQAGFQTFFLLVTLVPIKLCGYNPLKEASHGPSTRLEAPRAGVPDTA